MTDAAVSSAFGLLHEKVQRWIWRKGWAELRDIQERSIPMLEDRTRDLIIAAGTASGKTEAAFLPIVSSIARDQRPPGTGFGAMYIGPLRALINDQFGRLESLCEDLDLPVVRWHGDAPASIKQKAKKSPHGILLITPESIEALLDRGGAGQAKRLFGALSHIVIDELHSFMDAPRGRQLQSLLNRIEVAAGRRIARVGLSATLADMATAAAYLRPLDPGSVLILESKGGGQDLKLQLRGYIEPARIAADAESPAESAISSHLFETLRGRRSLVFAGSRRRVETMTAKLRELTEDQGVPEEFFAHHGSLSREHREEAETRMKDESRPASIICTTTLEMGIDVGHIESVAQLGPGQSVSGMRQRLGRSGRRAGHAAIMRAYITELEDLGHLHPLDALRKQTVQGVAMLNLMLRRWNEPPAPGRLHLSTLVHQILALIVQHGGLTAQQGWRVLVESGVFAGVTIEVYKALLRRMGDPEVALIEQAPDGTLLLGAMGEKITSGRDFYAVFMTPDEYRVVTDRGKLVGAMPLEVPYQPGEHMIFAGKRWRVMSVDDERREIVVIPAKGGRPPSFGGSPAAPADGVIAEMRRVYETEDVPAFLNSTAQDLLGEGREAYRRLGLHEASACRHGDQLLLFPWVGARAQEALLLALAGDELEPQRMGLAIGVSAQRIEPLRESLHKLAHGPAPDAYLLALGAKEKERDKYDRFLGEELLSLDYASACLDATRVPELAAALLGRFPGTDSYDED